jgi:hypothetical protein
MKNFNKSIFCRTAAVLLVVLLAFQSEYLVSQGTDPLATRLAAAKASYAAGDFEGARAVLEAMLPELEETGAGNALKGEACLFLGAALEKLQEKDLAVVQYCRAKELLGENVGSEGLDLAGLKYYAAACPPPLAPVVAEDVLLVRFAEARRALFAEDYEGAKALLEKLVADLAQVQGRDTLKGETYLLAGASYEKLKYKDLSIKYFCLAKDILGEGRTIEGLKLKDYKHYRAECRLVAVAGAAAAKKRGGGRFLGALLGLAVLAVGGYFLYTKVIKKKDEDEQKDIYYETEYQAWNCWHAQATSSSSTPPTISPSSNWAPLPSHGNNYDSTSTVSITGPKITSWSIRFACKACKGLTRRDIIYVNDVQKLDVTNTFPGACGGTINEFCDDPAAGGGKSYTIASGSGEATLKLRHTILFSLPSGAVVQVLNSTGFVGR